MNILPFFAEFCIFSIYFIWFLVMGLNTKIDSEPLELQIKKLINMRAANRAITLCKNTPSTLAIHAKNLLTHSEDEVDLSPIVATGVEELNNNLDSAKKRAGAGPFIHLLSLATCAVLLSYTWPLSGFTIIGLTLGSVPTLFIAVTGIKVARREIFQLSRDRQNLENIKVALEEFREKERLNPHWTTFVGKGRKSSLREHRERTNKSSSD